MATDEAPAPAQAASRSFTSRVLGSRITLWIAFLLVHLALGYLCLHADGLPLGDVTLVYQPWALQAQTGLAVPGITGPWVYPVLALVPIMLPLVTGVAGYAGAWLTMVTMLNAVAFAVLTVRPSTGSGNGPSTGSGTGPSTGSGTARNIVAAWWWLAFLLLLGPIAVARLDAVSVAIVIVALLWLGLRPQLAAVLLAVATWIKVWPAAIIASLIVASRHRWRMLLAVVATSLVVVVLALGLGSGLNVFSFITQQAGRGLQIEAPISVPWMWAAALKVPGSYVYYDSGILTFQVTGANIDTAIALMTPLLGIAVVAVLLIGIRAMHHGAPPLAVLPTLSLAVVTTMIAFNKVGSPQYVAWLAAPVILGLIYPGRAFRAPAILVAVTAAMTQLIYPYLYDWLLTANAIMVLVVSVRNVLFFVILGWAVAALWRSARLGDRHVPDPDPAAVWPFASHAAAPEVSLDTSVRHHDRQNDGRQPKE
jgi:Uncharacterized protein conserved in bacteria with the myosin-like domain